LIFSKLEIQIAEQGGFRDYDRCWLKPQKSHGFKTLPFPVVRFDSSFKTQINLQEMCEARMKMGPWD
jgi:hypothetical protein